MARPLTFEPDTEVPFALRLAQFLLSASDSMGQYNQTLTQQSKLMGDQIDQEERSTDRKSALALRDKQISQFDEDRTLARQERLAAAEAKGRTRTTTNKFYQDLNRLYPDTQLPQVEDPSSLDPNAFKFVLEKLLPKPYAPPEKVSPGEGIRNPKTGGYDVPLPKVQEPPQPPQKVAPGEGVRNAQGGYDVPIPAAVPKEPAPSRERDYHAMALKNLGPGKDPADYAAEARRLALKDETEVAGVRADAALSNQMKAQDQRDANKRAQLADAVVGDLSTVDTVLSKMEQLVPQVNYGGPLGRAGGVLNKVAEVGQTNPNVNRLADVGRAYMSIIAKVISRQSGVLSDQDLKRAEGSIPLPTDRLEVAQNKIVDLKDIINTARQNAERLRRGESFAPSAPGSEPKAGRKIVLPSGKEVEVIE